MNLEMIDSLPPWEWPKETAETLLDTLRNEQIVELERLLAAQMAGEMAVINNELASVLLAVLENTGSSQSLRSQAAISLGPVLELAHDEDFIEPDEVPISDEVYNHIRMALEKLYRDGAVPTEVRRRVLEASVRAPDAWHEDVVRAAWSSGDTDWQLTAIFAMQWIGGFEPQILEALGSENKSIRRHAVEAAGNWGMDKAWEDILSIIESYTKNPMLADEEGKVLLLTAIDAVVNIHTGEAGIVLGDLLDSDDVDIVDAANEAMVMAESILELHEFESEGEFDDDNDNDNDEDTGV